VIPVVVVTGFLGSGKTTLLNRMLARRAARGATATTLGLIVNELGAVGIDGDLLPADAARQVELPGGCVCCVASEDLERNVIDMIDRYPGLETIVLETTGVAEPLAIAWAFEREPLVLRTRLAVIVTLVDATRFRASRAISPAVDQQVVHADVLVVTKSDLVPAADVAAAVAEAVILAPRAPVVRGTTDEIAAWLERTIADPPLRDAAPAVHAHDHDHHDGDHHGIDSVWLPIDGVVDLEELEDRLAELPSAFVRIKGIARAVDGRTGSDRPRWVAFHRVGLRVSSETIDATATHARNARVVGLGPGVTVEPLERCVAGAVISSSRGGRD
jgi:G3E family GTPase